MTKRKRRRRREGEEQEREKKKEKEEEEETRCGRCMKRKYLKLAEHSRPAEVGGIDDSSQDDG